MSDRIKEAENEIRRLEHRRALIADVDWPGHLAQALANARLLAVEEDRRLEWLEGQGYVHTATRYVTPWREVTHD